MHAPMTDDEMTARCAKVIGLTKRSKDEVDPMCPVCDEYSWPYEPLINDWQAMALMKKLHLQISYYRINEADEWRCVSADGLEQVHHENLNHAIVECVARMQKSCTR